jgi:hypothetical protein
MGHNCWTHAPHFYRRYKEPLSLQRDQFGLSWLRRVDGQQWPCKLPLKPTRFESRIAVDHQKYPDDTSLSNGHPDYHPDFDGERPRKSGGKEQ